jgi:hypothetical protein
MMIRCGLGSDKNCVVDATLVGAKLARDDGVSVDIDAA